MTNNNHYLSNNNYNPIDAVPTIDKQTKILITD